MPAPIKELTARQREVLLYIQHCIDNRGIPPTIKEICAWFGWTSTNAASDNLEALQRKGWLSLGGAYRSARTMTVLYRAVPVYLEQRNAVGAVVLVRA